MDYRMKRIASCLLARFAIVIGGTGVGTYGAQTGGVSAVIAIRTFFKWFSGSRIFQNAFPVSDRE